MPTLQEQIVEKFLASLAESTTWDAERLAKLRQVLTAEKTARPEDFVRVFAMPAGGDIA